MQHTHEHAPEGIFQKRTLTNTIRAVAISAACSQTLYHDCMGDGSGAMATETERMSTRKFIVNGRRVVHRQGIAIVTVVACVRDVVITVVATGPSAHPTKAAALTVAAVCYILYAHHMEPPSSFAQVCCKNTTAKSLFIVSTLWHSVKIACSGGWLGGTRCKRTTHCRRNRVRRFWFGGYRACRPSTVRVRVTVFAHPGCSCINRHVFDSTIM